MSRIYEPGTRVNVFRNGSKVPGGVVVSYNADKAEYKIRMKSGSIWTAWATWVKAVGER
jgi:hypothetical protein